jgi:hypothetical protein
MREEEERNAIKQERKRGGGGARKRTIDDPDLDVLLVDLEGLRDLLVGDLA